MYYSIERTLDVLPYIAYIVIGLGLVLLEFENFKGTARLDSIPERCMGGFIPPKGKGYEYYVSNSNLVYILQKGKKQFRVYLILGNAPNINMKHDRYGSYFNISCEDEATAERIIDNLFANGMAT